MKYYAIDCDIVKAAVALQTAAVVYTYHRRPEVIT